MHRQWMKEMGFINLFKIQAGCIGSKTIEVDRTTSAVGSTKTTGDELHKRLTHLYGL